jgi:hypothetical protein
MKPYRTIFAGLVILISLCTGCIRRTIMVQTDPPGALIHLNDQEIGRSPVTVPFTFYGTYDVRIEKQGFATMQTAGVAEGPWWEAPIVDLIAELGEDRVVQIQWNYKLKKTDLSDTKGLLDRAIQLRRQLSESP